MYCCCALLFLHSYQVPEPLSRASPSLKGAGVLLQGSPELLTVMYAAVRASLTLLIQLICIFIKSPFVKNGTVQRKNELIPMCLTWQFGNMILLCERNEVVGFGLLQHTQRPNHICLHEGLQAWERVLQHRVYLHTKWHTQKMHLRKEVEGIVYS